MLEMRTGSWIVVVAAIAIICTMVYQSHLQWIDAGNAGVIYNARTGLQDKVYDPQRLYIPWRCSLYQYPTQVKSAVYTQDPTMGEVKAADGIALVTNDNANTIFDIFVFYRVDKGNVVKVFNKFGAKSIEEIQTTQLRSFTRDVANLVSTSYDIFGLMGPERAEASAKMTTVLRDKMEPYGITVEYVLLGTAYPSDSTMSKINERVNALTDLQIAGIKGDIAEVQRQTSAITAHAETEAEGIKAVGTKARSLELLRLDADIKAAGKWDGALPMAPAKSGQSLMFSDDLMKAMLEAHKERRAVLAAQAEKQPQGQTPAEGGQ